MTAARSEASAFLVWSAFALLLALSAVPVFSTVLPPLLDYPNHLARMHLLAEGGNAFYTVRWEVLPNLAQDLIVPPLARVIPLDLAAKLFLIMIFALIAGGVIWLNRVATGGWRLWPLLGFLFLYNRILLWGFVNYLFGIGVALVGIALWFAMERRSWWLRVLSSSLVALACFFSHIAAFGFYALSIIGVEILPAIAETRVLQWPALVRRFAIGVVQFVVPAALWLGLRHEIPAGTVSYAAIWRKADLLFSVFDNYNRAVDVICFALFLALIGGLLWTRRLGLVPRLGAAMGLIFVAYLLLPSQIYSGSGADHRLPTALFLLLVAASAPRFPKRRIGAAVGVFAALVLVARMGVIERVWLAADRVYSADLVGIDALPQGSKLAIAHPPDLFHVAAIPEVHLPALAIARREAFVPTLFASAGQQPVALKPEFTALAEAAQPPRLWAALTATDIAARVHLPSVLDEFDFVAFVDRRSIRLPPHRCLAQVSIQPTFQIYAVRHDLDCAGSDG